MTSRLMLLLLLCLSFFQPGLAQDVRKANLQELNEKGFRVAPSLPIGGTSARKLRPEPEIESRLKALRCYVLWVAAPDPEKAGTFKKLALGKYSNWLTDEEKQVLALEQSDANQRYLDQIGWQIENMWALAWVLGFQHEPDLFGQVQGDLARDLVFKFSGKGTFQTRKTEEVIRLEDLFYCAHNAVRSAQNGAKTVPFGYDPIAEGGGVHERRHALTWCLSPGVSWEDTDLST